MDLKNVKESKNFVDNTNWHPMIAQIQQQLFWEAMKAFYKDGVRNDGTYTFEDPNKFPLPLTMRRSR